MRHPVAGGYRDRMSDDPLHGTTWARTRGDAVAWIRFTDGSANGSDGCNLIGGPYLECDEAVCKAFRPKSAIRPPRG